MTNTQPEIAPFTDPLSETLHLLRLTGMLYCRSGLTAPWGLDMPPLDGYMMFHIVTAGRCLLEVPGEEPLVLDQGSLTLVPHGRGHRMLSSAGISCQPLLDIPVEKISDRYEIMRYGGGGELTQITCCVIRFDQLAAQRLIALLPAVLRLDIWHSSEDAWLQSTLHFISREAREMKPGGETMMTHLADILIIQTLRSWIDSEMSADKGWLVALRDKQIGQALAAIHKQPGKNWTLANLAKEVNMSRSAFAARFTQLLGEPVMQYLTRWRMQLAYSELQQSKKSLAVLAEDLGYLSEAAFSRAFKREYGLSPGKVRSSSKEERPLVMG